MDYLNEDSRFKVENVPVERRSATLSNRLRGLQTIAMSRLTYRVRKVLLQLPCQTLRSCHSSYLT